MNENDNFKVRDYAPDKDYDTLTNWFSKLDDGKGWIAPDKNWLENGLIIDGYCAAFLHLAKTGKGKNNFGYLWPIVSNIESNVMKRDRALDLLLKNITKYAENKNCNFLYTTISTPSLIKRLNTRHNMLIAETNMTSLVLPLGSQDNISLECMVNDEYIEHFPESK